MLVKILAGLVMLSVLVALGLGLGLWLIPGADASTLAALDVYKLIGERVGRTPEEGPDERPTMAEVVLASAAVAPDEQGDPVLRLYGVNLLLLDGKVSLDAAGLARRSLVRGLREQAAARGLSLRVEGELQHGAVRPSDGASFLATRKPATGG